MTRSKFWFPVKGLAAFFVVVVAAFYFFLTAFDPHIERNPAEWGPKKVNPKASFWMRVIEKQIKTPKK
jgi:hypothetical protein